MSGHILQFHNISLITASSVGRKTPPDREDPCNFSNINRKETCSFIFAKYSFANVGKWSKIPKMRGRLRWRACRGLCFRIVCDKNLCASARTPSTDICKTAHSLNSLCADRCQGYDPRGVKETNSRLRSLMKNPAICKRGGYLGGHPICKNTW